MNDKTIDIVFDGPIGPESPHFVEVERDGKSIRIGEWVQREDGYWMLRIPDPEAAAAKLAKVRELEDHLRDCDYPSGMDTRELATYTANKIDAILEAE